MDGWIKIDQMLFKRINGEWVNPFFDLLFPFITDLHLNFYVSFIILPIALCVWAYYEKKKAAIGIVMILLGVLLSDTISYRLIKVNVKRERPEKVLSTLQLRTPSHSGYSFPSNHAANVASLAFILRFLYPHLRTFAYIAIFLIAYSRIYVGVHFPMDVAAGIVVGLFSAFIVITLRFTFSNELLRKRYNKYILKLDEDD